MNESNMIYIIVIAYYNVIYYNILRFIFALYQQQYIIEKEISGGRGS